MYGEQGVKAVHKNACLVKIWGIGYSFFLVQRLHCTCKMYYATTGYTCKILYGTCTQPHNQTLQTYTISVCAYVGVLYS